MRKKTIFSRRATSVTVALTAFVTMLAPGFASIVAADQLTDQSIYMSTSAAGSTGVTYEVKFTLGSTGAGAFVFDFCDNSAVVNTSCSAPAGFSAASVGTSTAGATVTHPAASTIKVVKAYSGGAAVDIVLTGLVNPNYVTDATTGFYARFVSYANSTDADAYTATAAGSSIDTGGIALATTYSIGVTATVRESMTFCVAGATITENCGDAATHLPNITLGTSGALDPSNLDTADIYTQLSTNAVSGAVINVKSDATDCGGLMLFGSSSCYIVPATGTELVAGFAGFGVKLHSAFATTGAANPVGTLEAASGSTYNTSNYVLNFVAGNGSGVTGPYGDPILDTNSQPVNNENMQLTFGASITPNTPAGSYSASLNLIATGKY